MDNLIALCKKYSFILILFIVLGIIFRPLLLHGQIPFSSNLLVSFFNPWAHEEIVGWPQGVPNKPVGIDDLRIFYPQRHFTTESLRHFSLPFWDPYIFSGGYHVGLSETAVFYPLFFLFMLLPQLPVWIGMILVEPILASVGMYLFLRKILDTKSAAIFGSIVFGFSGLMIVRMVEGLSVGNTLIWTAWALFAIEAFFQKKQVRFLVLLLISLCFSLLAGWFQFAFYAFILSFLYALFKYFGSQKSKDLIIFIPFLFLPCITLFQIVPALEAFMVSSRGTTSIQALLALHLMPLSHLITYLYPDFWGNPGAYNFFGKSEYKESILFIGVVPFILSLFSWGCIKNKRILFFWIITVVALLLGSDSIFSRTILSVPIPIVSSFLPDRVFYFATISLCVLCAFGFEWIVEKKKNMRIAVWIVSIIVLSCIGIVHGYIFSSFHQQANISWLAFLSQLHLVSQQYQLLIAEHNLYISDSLIILSLITLLAGFWIPKKIIISILFFLTISGQVYFAGKYIPFSQKQFVFPPTPVFTYLGQHAGINRFISTGNGYIPANSSLYFDLYSPDGVGSMYIGRYGELVTYMQTKEKDYTHIPRIEIRIDPSADEILSGGNPYLLRFMQIDGIRYVVRLKSDPALVNPILFNKVWADKNWEIYSYKQVLQRIFWTSDILVGNSQSDILHTIFSSQGKTIVLEKNPTIKNTKNAKGSVSIVVYKPSEITLISNATGNGYIYLSDNFARQWKAFVDGHPTNIVRANYSLMAVPVAAGNHTVMLEYNDTNETLALMITGFTGLLIIVGTYILIKLKKAAW